MINMKKTLSLTIHSQRWGTMWVDHVCQPQLATCGPLINLPLFKWPQIWHKHAQSHAKCCLHHALPISFEIFRKFMQKLKFKGYIICETSIDHTKIAFSIMLKHVMVWWYITLWQQNTIWTAPKSFIHYSKTWERSFETFTLMAYLYQVVSIKNDKHEEKIFL